MPSGTLEVIVVEGRDLKDKDLMGQNDAFVEIYIDKKYKQRTTTISNTNNPIWNERFTFNLQKNDETIHFDVYDADLIGRDSIGNCKIKLKHVFDDGKYDEWVKLPAMFGLSSKGQIHIIMNFTVRLFQFNKFQIKILHFISFLAIIITTPTKKTICFSLFEFSFIRLKFLSYRPNTW